MCVKNKEAKSRCLQSSYRVFFYLPGLCWSKSERFKQEQHLPHFSVHDDLWPLPTPTAAAAGLKRMTVIQKKNKTLLDQFPRGRNKHIRSHSSSDRDGPRAQGAQQKRHETVRKGGNRWGDWGGVRTEAWAPKIKRTAFTLLLRNIFSKQNN